MYSIRICLLPVFFLTGLSLIPLRGLEQTFRTSWEWQNEISIFYRVGDAFCRSEILVIRDEADSSWTPGRFILESPCCVLGNLRPGGLFRSFGMTSLLSRDALAERTCYRADRSAVSLNSPGGAFFLPDKGGLFFEKIGGDF